MMTLYNKFDKSWHVSFGRVDLNYLKNPGRTNISSYIKLLYELIFFEVYSNLILSVYGECIIILILLELPSHYFFNIFAGK